MPALNDYQRKRNFERTPEPAGGNPTLTGRSFVIQKHDASRLHYDLRLEMDGVLRSWAVPKGPSYHPGDKRLAVHVEDHPLDYGTFEGVIPPGEYGGGTVMLWDRGTYDPLNADAATGYRNGEIKLTFHGERLRGRWVLVRTRMGKHAGGDDRNWLFIKERDDHTMSAKDAARWLDQQHTSIKTGRTMADIAEDADASWTPAGASDDASAIKSPPAERYDVQLATLVDETPAGDDWLHEIKLDGYRVLARKLAGDVTLRTRNHQDWTRRFPGVAAAVRKLPAAAAVVDGEAVVLDDAGVSRFGLLQKSAANAAEADAVVFYAFDLLHLGNDDLRQRPLLERKARLKKLVDATPGDTIRYSNHLAGTGPNFRDEACDHDLEGIISKRCDAPYTAGRSPAWVKSKCVRRQEFVVVGYTNPTGSRVGFGALLLATRIDGKLTYCGRVGTGFDDDTLRTLAERLHAMHRRTHPLDTAPPRRERRDAHWVTPSLVAEVGFAEFTDDGMLRHARFLGLRDDKPAQQVGLEVPHHPEDAPVPEPTASIPADVRLTNPDRVLFPGQGITKRDLALYYAAVAGWMLPHVIDRPLSLVRCPRGRAEKCFYQKHFDDNAPDSLRLVEVEEDRKATEYATVRDAAGLVALVQLGVLEIHPWPARADRLDRPDRMVIDLDPGPGTTFADVIDAALLFRDALAHLGVTSYPMLTGGKGVHVITPIERRTEWDDLKAFARALAEQVAAADPGRFTTNMSKAKRTGRIFIDYLRNGRGATAVAPYSTRRHEGAPCATPIAWDELREDTPPDHYRVTTLPARLRSLDAHPWAGYDDRRQPITAAMRRAVGLD